jgi:hypothetical protein
MIGLLLNKDQMSVAQKNIDANGITSNTRRSTATGAKQEKP